ncbi:MAG TPA: hypothetical protein VN903_03910 [Polyangia bacterium]|nr:hypothetical protein [Polyangia bacterium]
MRTVNTHKRLAFVRPWAATATLLLAGACANDPTPAETQTSELTRIVDGPDPSTGVVVKPPVTTPPLPPLPPRPPEPVAPTVLALERGTGWRRIQVSGTAEDLATGTMGSLSNEFYVINGRASINNTALPANTRAVLNDQLATVPMPTSGDNEIIVVPRGLNDTIQAQANGVVTAALCDDSTHVFSKSYNFDKSYDYHRSSEPGALVGSGDFHVQLKGGITGEVKYEVRYSWCWPTFVFHRMTVSGAADVLAQANLVAQFQKQWSWNTTVAEPVLGTVSLYGIPITFTAPITVGIDAAAAASLNFNGAYQAHGDFNIYCNGNGCDGSKNATSGFQPGGSPVVSATGKVKVVPWVEGAIKAKLLDENVAYAQVGVRAKLTGELWAYAGNNCGDSDHDGVNEYVTGATLDLGVGIDLVVGAGIFGSDLGGPWSWNLVQRHLAFWGTGDAVDPIFYGGACGGYNTATMHARMRPCWPYSDPVTYKVTWSDGAIESFNAAPSTLLTKTHAFATYGLKSVRLDAMTDSQGRTMAGDATRTVNISYLPTVCFDDLVLAQ